MIPQQPTSLTCFHFCNKFNSVRWKTPRLKLQTCVQQLNHTYFTLFIYIVVRTWCTSFSVAMTVWPQCDDQSMYTAEKHSYIFHQVKHWFNQQSNLHSWKKSERIKGCILERVKVSVNTSITNSQHCQIILCLTKKQNKSTHTLL